MLERGESRRRELEIRTALGATAARLAGEGLVEAGLLGATAGFLGVAIALGAVGATRAIGGAALTGLASARVSWPVVGFALAVSLGAALLAGLLPCVRLLRTDVARWLPTEGSARPPSLSGSLPSSIVVAQIGLSVGLIVVGGMLARDFSRLAAVDVGYQAKGVLSAQVALSPVRHPDGGRQFLGSLLERLRGAPGVQAAALVHPVPGALVVGGFSGRVEGFGDEHLEYRVVSASFFSLLRIPIVAGRSFTDAEVTRADPVVVVTNAFAEKYWGAARSALGRHIGLGWNPAGTPSGEQLAIVGVARDFRDAYMRFPPEMYMTYTRAARGHPLPEMSLLVRGTEGDLPSLRARLARAIEEVDPNQPLYNVRALEDLVTVALVRTRLLLFLVGVFSALATLLAAVGIYVVLAFAVIRRTQELGIRLALGATRRDVLRLVLGRTSRLVAKGVVLTVPVTFCAIWLFAAQLFGVTDTDPMTCVWAVGLIAAVAVIASIVPAWRATRIDPTVALRQE